MQLLARLIYRQITKIRKQKRIDDTFCLDYIAKVAYQNKILSKIRSPWRESLHDKASLWRGGLHGFERETFRLDTSNGRPAASAHEVLFSPAKQAFQIQRFCGSEAEKVRLQELLPHSLTLDFSDQQSELVSPPRSDISSAEADITLLLRFVAGELELQGCNEFLWAFSQPPIFEPDDLAAVRIANFANAPNALYNEQYREQLVLRYGKAKQSWTGVHYNFSLDLQLFADLEISHCETYVHLSRNLWRNLWLLELLFGCSPQVSPFYVQQIQQHFTYGGRSIAAPPVQACSLHSHFAYGYRSSEQQMQYLNYSSASAYWQSIERIAQVNSSFFQHLGLHNSRLIQDSRELYTPFRLKQLHAHGNECCQRENCLVDYLELRILDIDPMFIPENLSGIHLPATYLSHLLLLHSTLLSSPPLEHQELLHCAKREQYVLSLGTDIQKLPGALKKEAQNLLQELGDLAELLQFPNPYAQAVQSAVASLETGQIRVWHYWQAFPQSPDSLPEYRQALYRHSQAWTNALKEKPESPIAGKFDMSVRGAGVWSQRFVFGHKDYADLELSTQCLIIAAQQRELEVEVLDHSSNTLRLSQKGQGSGNGRSEMIMQATKTRADSYVCTEIMGSKKVTKLLLHEAGLRVPQGRDYQSFEQAINDWAYYKQQQKSWIVKPNSTNYGVGISRLERGQFGREDYQNALRAAFSYDKSVLIEEYILGKEYRFLVIGSKLRAILHRIPANVCGDGQSSIAELVAMKNTDPWRIGPQGGHISPLEVLELGATECGVLREQGLNPESIPASAQQVFLRHNSNISTGGDSLDMTDSAHPGYVRLAENCTDYLKAQICGVDIISANLAGDPAQTEHAIIEANFNPVLYCHEYPAQGQPRSVASAVLDLLFSSS